ERQAPRSPPVAAVSDTVRGPRLEIRRGPSGTPVVALVRDLLTQDESAALRASLLALEPRFVDAGIGGAREDWRLGRVIYDPPPEAELVAERVGELALEAATALDVRLHAVASI